jgi:protein required for attachment to host cells
MSTVWVLVADASRARVFAADNRVANTLEEVTDHLHPESRLHNRDLVSDRPGRASDRASVARSAVEEEGGPKDHQATVFARELAGMLSDAAGEGKFEHLVLCAPPAFMGELREKLDDGVRQRISAEVTKDLTRAHRGADIRTHLPDYLY